jgi:hypothetical protein
VVEPFAGPGDIEGAFLHDAPSIEDEDPIDVSKKPH